jgi:hypothetical protein
MSVPLSPPESEGPPQTPVLTRASLDIIEANEPGSSVPSFGKFRLSPNNWSDSSDSNATIEIPEYLESLESLEYLELEPWKANRIWTTYCDSFQTGGLGPYTFFDIVKRQTLRHDQEDALLETDDWVGVLSRCGVKQKFIDRIMDPDWKNWRLSGSAKEWLRLNLEDRWSYLSHFNTVIQDADRGGSDTTILDESGQLITSVPATPTR